MAKEMKAFDYKGMYGAGEGDSHFDRAPSVTTAHLETMPTALPFRPMKSFKPLSLDELTESLASVSDIEMLDLSAIGADLNDAILRQIAEKYNNLSKLNLSNCENITDEALHAIISKNPALTDLDISGCKVTDGGLASISLATTKLTHVNLNGCEKVTDVGLHALAITQDQLQYLNISGCTGVTDEGKEKLRKYLPYASIAGEGIRPEFTTILPGIVPGNSFDTLMTYLAAESRANLASVSRGNKLEVDRRLDSLTAFKPKDLAALNFVLGKITDKSQIRNLDLSALGVSLTDEVLGNISQKCHNITSLNLSGCIAITNDGLGAIADTNNDIADLNLTWCMKITDTGLRKIATANHKITNLNLSNCSQITDDGLRKIAKTNTGIKNLNLTWCEGITDAGLGEIAETNNGITHLNLESCQGITDDGLIAIAATNHGITDLNLTRCTITDDTLVAIAVTNHRIAHFSLSGCSEITDDGLRAIAFTNNGITHLNLHLCYKITNAALVAIAAANHGITHLNLHSFYKITNDGLAAIAATNSDIVDLNLAWCSITDDGLAAIAAANNGITHLNLYNCDRITDDGLAAIAAANNGITHLNLYNCSKITDDCLRAIAAANPGIIFEGVEGFDRGLSLAPAVTADTGAAAGGVGDNTHVNALSHRGAVRGR